MEREEMIDFFIEDRFSEWVYARCHDGLEDILYFGWKGYDSYTQEELEEAFMKLLEENFDKEKAEKIRQEQARIEQNIDNPKK